MRGWRVFVCGVRLGDEGLVERAAEDLLEALLADPRVAGPVVSGREEGRVGAVVAVDAETVEEAVGIAAEAVGDALEKAGLPRRIELVEAEPEDREATPPSLLGASEVARILGVSRQRVYQLLEERPDFPRPAVRLSRGGLWRRREVLSWAAGRRAAGEAASGIPGS